MGRLWIWVTLLVVAGACAVAAYVAFVPGSGVPALRREPAATKAADARAAEAAPTPSAETAAAPVAVASADPGERRLALVVWQSNYQSLSKLTQTRDEAEQIRHALEQIGFDVDMEGDLDARSLSKTFQNYWRRLDAAGDDAVGFIYYTGHGVQDPDPEVQDNYLLGTDADIESAGDLAFGGIALQQLIDALEKTRPKIAFVVVDACRDEPVFDEISKSASGSGKGLKPVSAALDMGVAYATAAGKTAEEGVYAPSLAKRLVQPKLLASEVFSRTQVDVAQATAKDGRVQYPEFINRIYSKFCFNGCPDDAGGAVLTAADKEELQAWQTASLANTAQEYRRFLDAYPTSRFSGAAKGLLTQFETGDADASAGASAADVVKVRADARESLVSATPLPASKWPFLGTLRMAQRNGGYMYACDVTAISRMYVITAAHCLEQSAQRNADGWEWRPRSQTEVVLGTVDLAEVQPSNVFGIDDVIIHPAFVPFRHGDGNDDWSASRNDIAILRLDRPWSGAVSRLSGSFNSDPDTDAGIAFVAGFGMLSGDDRPRVVNFTSQGRPAMAQSRVALQSASPALDTKSCLAGVRDDVDIGSGFICIGNDVAADASKVTCTGASGSPIAALDDGGNAYQVGLISWGIGCSRDVATFGTRISAVRDFIAANVPDAVFVYPDRETSAQVVRRTAANLVDLLRGSESGVEVQISQNGVPSTVLVDGSDLQIKVTPRIPGELMVLDIDASGQLSMLFPDIFGDEDARVTPGKAVSIPGDEYTVRVAPPFGKGQLVAIVLPDEVAKDIHRQVQDSQTGGRVVGNSSTAPPAPEEIVWRALERASVSEDPDLGQTWAAAVQDYQVIPRPGVVVAPDGPPN
ncbi:MAG: trypsin-like serine protease [Hyphomonas sp.]|nr:trypsin-like serine protease [Hyphomonas sp.]